MRDLAYLQLLAREFPNREKAGAEIINLQAICALPKGTEYFFSDLHGEYENFAYLLRSSSGIIRAKIEETYGNLLSEEEQLSIANLIYYPKDVLGKLRREGLLTQEWKKLTINRLTSICHVVASKYTRSKVRKKMPPDYAYVIDELLHQDSADDNKKSYYREIIQAIADAAFAEDFIAALCELIRNLTIDELHIIGDIFDRGPRSDLVMEELMNFHDVDVQWGNHDVNWMGAAAGNTACIANVLRIGISYNSFDALEDGYGINLRPLSMYAAEVYGDDPCTCFLPHLLDQNVYDAVNPELAAKMCKAITVIQLKLEGQLIKRHPEYGLEKRLLLDKIDYKRGVLCLEGQEYPLLDAHFPTIDPAHPYELTQKEQELISTLQLSFTHSQLLQRHIRFLYAHGSLYRICNGNLLYHGCIPMTEDGAFAQMHTPDGVFAGKKLMDYLNEKIRDAYSMDDEEAPQARQAAVDLMWYLWCGPNSPLFGKDKIATFEHIFLADEALKAEKHNPYYRLVEDEETVNRILEEFGLSTERAHIINGHVPVKVRKGESPVKAGGKLFIIDGGISKAYQKQTGIAGYTLIFNSRHLALAMHKPFVPGEENTPQIRIVEQMRERIMVRDTDTGRELLSQIEDLKELIEAYSRGAIRENH